MLRRKYCLDIYAYFSKQTLTQMHMHTHTHTSMHACARTHTFSLAIIKMSLLGKTTKMITLFFYVHVFCLKYSSRVLWKQVNNQSISKMHRTGLTIQTQIPNI